MKFLGYFSFTPRHVIHQVAVPLQARCNCNVEKWTLSIPGSLIVTFIEITQKLLHLQWELRAWIKVTQYCWHNCKKKISEKWRNIGKIKKWSLSGNPGNQSYNFSHYCFGFWRDRVVFGSFGNEPMQSCSVRYVVIVIMLSSVLSSSASVYSCPSDSFDYRNFISCRYMHLYAPSLCTWNIKSMWNVDFLNGSHFSRFLYVALLSTWLNLEPSYLAQLCIYTGTTQREKIMHTTVSSILKVMKYLINSHFALLCSFGIHAKDTKFINGRHTTHTEKYRYT